MATADRATGTDVEIVRHELEDLARRDARIDWSGVPDGSPLRGAQTLIDRWAETHLAECRVQYEIAVDALRTEVALTEAAVRDGRIHVRAATGAVAAEQARCDGQVAVLRGEREADDGGDWRDLPRLSQDPRRARWVDVLVYGSAAIADAGLNYLAFRLMGATPVETAVLAGAVVLVSVLLPKAMGELVTVVRRTRRNRRWFAAKLVAAGVLWTSVMGFVSVVRSSYLLLPREVGLGIDRPSLLATAGVSSTVLTVGWLAASLAVGMVVLVRAARRYNPYAAGYESSAAKVTTLAERSAAAQEVCHRAEARFAEAELRLKAVPAAFESRAEAIRADGRDLAAHYVHTLHRERNSVVVQSLGQPPHIALVARPEEAS